MYPQSTSYNVSSRVASPAKCAAVALLADLRYISGATFTLEDPWARPNVILLVQGDLPVHDMTASFREARTHAPRY